MSTAWKEIAIGVAAVGAGAALLYYLLKEEPKGKHTHSGDCCAPTAAKSGGKITRDELLVILKTISKSQEEMKSIMADLMKEVINTKPSFAEMYQLVKKRTPEDPLEKAGITMQEFDQMLDQNQEDPEIRRAIMALMGGDASSPVVTAETSSKVQALTVLKIREIHQYMLEELRTLVPQAAQVDKPEGKTIAITAQALVGAKVENKFGLTADEVEAAVRHHHTQLAVDQDFATLALQVQQIMSQLMSH